MVDAGLLAELASPLERTGFVRVGVLFGSAARGTLRSESDLDIGILPTRELSLAEELDLQAELERLARRPVDLVRLDRASTLLRWEVAKNGVPIFSSSAGDVARFRAEAGIEHAEFVVRLEDGCERYRHAILGGSSP